MMPAARLQAAIDIVELVIAAARDNGPAADTIIANWLKTRRFAGSGDRRAIREHVYQVIRAFGQRPASARAAFLGLAEADEAISALFDGSVYGPAEKHSGEPVEHPSALAGWIVDRLSPLVIGDGLESLAGRAPLDLRVNALKATRETVLDELGDAIPIAGTRFGIRLPDNRAIEKMSAYLEGRIEVQDAGSQIISELCCAKPGEIAVDLCAGAGGKTLALAGAMEGRGQLIACDAVRSRLSQLEPRAKRAGADFVETRLLDMGREMSALDDLIEKADLVLIDAPCSGTGTWRRNPEARWRMTGDRLEATLASQSRLLDIGAGLVRPGGHLVYAVCSLMSDEGEGQMARFLSRHTGWFPAKRETSAGRAAGAGLLLTPRHDETDGFFVARLEKAC